MARGLEFAREMSRSILATRCDCGAGVIRANTAAFHRLSVAEADDAAEAGPRQVRRVLDAVGQPAGTGRADDLPFSRAADDRPEGKSASERNLNERFRQTKSAGEASPSAEALRH